MEAERPLAGADVRPRVVWQLDYQKEEGKPYFHPITVAGSPSLTEFRPADHPKSFRHPTPWYLIGSMPCLARGALPGTLYPSGEKEYPVEVPHLVRPSPVNRDATEKPWQQFSKQE